MNQILIIDDSVTKDDDFGKHLSDFFRAEGYETIFSDEGEAALDVIENDISNRNIKLVLLDLAFPGQPLEGREIFDKIKEKRPYIPIVILTVSDKLGDYKELLDRGSIDYVVKETNKDRINKEKFERWEKEIDLCKQNEMIHKHQNNIREILCELRENIPKMQIDMSRPSDIMVKLEWLKGRTVTALNVTLTPTGCIWANTGGCTVCGEFSGSNLSESIKADTHIAQFIRTCAEEVGIYKPAWLRIYNEGSFLNPYELAIEAQEKIIEAASNIRGVERITIESRPEFITSESLNALRSKLRQRVELEIGMGLETKNDIIRNVLINKGESFYLYKKALKALKEHRTRGLAYVLLKPPFFSELDAVRDAESTIEFAFECGFDAVSLEPVSIHNFSFIDLLYCQGLYQPPWLWSVVRVVKDTFRFGEIRIGGLEYYPRPKTVAHNRHISGDGCNHIFWNVIGMYNATHNPDLFSLLLCGCAAQWEQELQPRTKALHETIKDIVEKIDITKYLHEVSR